MNLYEVVFWGSKGNPNAEDTIYLVRAPDFKIAIQLLDALPSPDRVYEIGRDLSVIGGSSQCILRGPYFAFAHNFGWRAWQKKYKNGDHPNEWREVKLDKKDVEG
jgi:hypothetical protein